MNKKYFSTKEFKLSTFLVLAISALTFFTSCKKDEDDDPYKSVTVQFKVTGSPGITYKSVTTQIGTEQKSFFTFEPAQVEWSSAPEITSTSAKALTVSTTADGVGASSFVAVSVYVDGVKKATDTAKGTDLISKLTYNFK